MAILRMREASFLASGPSVGPVSLEVRPAERRTVLLRTPREAAIVARMAAGIVKAGAGSVSIDEYDPHIQPVHCKRAAALVAHDPLPPDEFDFESYVTYRAALRRIEPERALAHARLLMDRLRGMHEAFAIPLVGALAGAPKLLVLDRPPAVWATDILAVLGPCAMLSTHVTPEDAAAFAVPCGAPETARR